MKQYLNSFGARQTLVVGAKTCAYYSLAAAEKEWPSQRLQKLAIEIRESDGANKAIVPLTCRIDTLDELEYFRNGGILQYVLRQLAA